MEKEHLYRISSGTRIWTKGVYVGKRITKTKRSKMKKLLFLAIVLTLSTACNKANKKYKVETTTTDGTNMSIKVNDSYVYQGGVVGTYEWEDTKDIDVRVKVWKQTSSGAVPTQGTHITLKQGKKVLTEIDEDILVW